MGNLFEEPDVLHQLLTPTEDFPSIRKPDTHDWLAQHEESGQTFDEYRDARSDPPDQAKRIIYLLPIGDFSQETSPDLDKITSYAAAFFQLPVKRLPAYMPTAGEFKPRANPHSHERQLFTREILQFLKTKLPTDGCCLLGITMTDLYPNPSWNYVFGEASLNEHVGIYSFARYDPAFWDDPRGENFREVILQRSCKVFSHEMSHMFGLPHCVYFSCLVNGANHLGEMDQTPLFACPVCLRKLHLAIGFDVVKRYRDLAEFYRTQKWEKELAWVERQLARLPPDSERESSNTPKKPAN